MLCILAWMTMLHTAPASEPFHEFLQALQDRGYGDSAADYLTLIRSRDDLPDNLRDVLDLEMATSLRIAAANTPNADEAARYLGGAQQYLDKFVREHPDHPESGMAYATYGDLASAKAESWLKAALAMTDKAEQESLLNQARAAYQEARAAYDRGRQAYQVRLDQWKEGARPNEKVSEKPPHSKPSREARQSDAEAIEARLVQVGFKLVMVDYQIAKTYLAETSPDRKEALAQAARGFDEIYQHYRTFQAGLYAHFWHGKTLVEMGDLETALDVFDEVLANAPEPQERADDSSFDELFAQVEQMRLTILSRQGHAGDVMAEAEEWLRENKSLQRSDGYQGVALELAKAQLAKAEGQSGEARRKSMQTVKVALAKISARPGGFQQEAILLQRKLRAQGDDAEPASFDEAVAVADAAANAGGWDGAIEGYTRAIELDRKGKKAAQANEVRLRLARAQWSAGKVADCLNTTEKLLDDKSAGEQASAAAALAIHAALKLVAATREPAQARERLAKVADSIVTRWPQSVEADEARMALGKMALLKGDDDQALAVFEAVIAASQRYPSAQHWSAVVHWRRYLRAKGQPSDQHDEASLLAERTRAVEQLTASLKAQQAAAGSAAPPREQMESQVLLAEIDLEGGQLDEAAALVGPLVPAVKALPPSEQDTLATRALIAALKAQILRKELPSAVEAATALIDRGGSSPQAGAVLFEFARLLRNKARLEAAAAPVEPSADTSAEAPPALVHDEAGREALVKVTEYLAQRPQMSAAATIFIAETLADLGKSDEARAQYKAILDRADKDPTWLAGDRSLSTRVRAKLLAFLRAEGRHEDALAQADRLVKENPKSLEPRMERGQIVQSWAETEPDRYPQAVAQWTELRTALQNMRPRPNEYYEVVYNAAFCLAANSEHSGDKTSARQAEQLLKSVLILSPSLSGEEMVAKYNSLVERCLKLQAEKPQPQPITKIKKR
jgi:tetratricopeptide (TPR) repeat protein